MGKCSSNLHELKPALVMVLVETVYSVVNICYKLAANDGMNLSVLVGYRFLFGAAFILPVAFLAERKKRPKLTRKIALYGFLCGLFGGALGQNLYLKGLVLTSATFASAMTNLVPAITFVVAISLRLERLAWNTAAGKAKVLGTTLGIGGAMVLTFYKGLELQPWNTNINLLETTVSHHHRSGLPHNEHGGYRYILGAFLSLASCLCYSLWLIVQAKAVEEYPCPYSITALMAMASSVQGVAFALCVERDWSQWNLGLDIRLFTVAFSGILGSGMMFSLVAWCVRTRGPLFVSIFQPLMLVMVALGGSLFLEEKLHLGMVIGAILIVGGLYIVLWGKGKEMKTSELTENIENEARIDIPPPLVQSGITNRAEAVAVAEERIDLGLPQNSVTSRAEAEAVAEEQIGLELPQNNNIDSRSCSEEMEVESQNESSNSSSSSREERRRQTDLPSPLETQNECIHSSSNNERVVEEEMPNQLQMQNDSSSSSRSGRVMEEQMKEVMKEMQARMAAKLEARLEIDIAEMQAQQQAKHKLPQPPPPPPS